IDLIGGADEERATVRCGRSPQPRGREEERVAGSNRMSTLRWGLVGASDIAATRVIPALRRLGQEITGVVSSSAERGRAYAEAHDVPWTTTGVDALLGRDDIDAIYVSTTNELHHDQVLAAAMAGKHVLCEKPLALSVDDAWEMVDACERTNLVLATNHHLPAAATHQTIRRLVAEGVVGRRWRCGYSTRFDCLTACRAGGWPPLSAARASSSTSRATTQRRCTPSSAESRSRPRPSRSDRDHGTALPKTPSSPPCATRAACSSRPTTHSRFPMPARGSRSTGPRARSWRPMS